MTQNMNRLNDKIRSSGTRCAFLLLTAQMQLENANWKGVYAKAESIELILSNNYESHQLKS